MARIRNRPSRSSWVHSSTRWCTACAPTIRCSSSGCRAWPISHFGPRACETAFWPAGTFARAYAANRRAAIESIIEADPLANCVRTIMSERSSWAGNASDLLRLCAENAREDVSMSPPWAKNPRALAGRLRRAQTFLRMLDIEIAFGREGRAGARMIRMSALGPSRSRAVGMDWEDGQNDGYRVNGGG